MAAKPGWRSARCNYFGDQNSTAGMSQDIFLGRNNRAHVTHSYTTRGVTKGRGRRTPLPYFQQRRMIKKEKWERKNKKYDGQEAGVGT